MMNIDASPLHRLAMACALLLVAACQAESVEPAPAPTATPSPGSAAASSDARQTAAVTATTAVCLKLCDKTVPLRCPGQPGCAAGCADMSRSAGLCAPAMDAFLACLVGQPVSNFECNDEGIPAVKDGLCTAEQAMVAKCLMTPMP